MDVFSNTSQFPKKHHRCISLESGQTLTKKSYPKTPLDLPRFYPRRYSTPELAMRKHALKYQRDDGRNEQPISNKSCQTDILGLDKYLHRSPSGDTSLNSAGHSAVLRTYKKPTKKPKVRSVGVHCERRRMTFAAFKGCQKFKHVYKRKISLPQPPSTATSTDDGRRDSGVLPKLRPDRTDQIERPAAAKAIPVVKLPRIPTRDAKPEPDRIDDCGGGGMRLAKLTRPQSTGSSGGGGSSSSDRKLAYFRASSAPKIDSRYYTLLTKKPQPPPEREQLSTAGSSDTADTTLDMSFVRQQSEENATATAATASTTTGTSSTTRTVSTSTTFTEPVFPIVFSCESVLRHPLDGGYVSHTESHRFSVHYVPIEDAKALTADDTDDGSRSSLVFTSAGACQNERCLTGDSISVTLGGVGGKPTDDSATVSRYEPSSTSNVAAGERRLFVERPNADLPFESAKRNVPGGTAVDGGVRPSAGQQPPADHWCASGADNRRPADKAAAETTITAKDRQRPAAYGAVKTVGLHVLGKGDGVLNGDVNAFEKAATVPPMPVDKTIDAFGEDDGGAEDGTALESHHAHTDDMPFQSDQRNYERLTQNNQIDSDRTVSNQSPKFDGTATGLGTIERHDDFAGPVENDAAHASELNTPRANDEPTEPSTTAADADAATKDQYDDGSTRQIQTDNDNRLVDDDSSYRPHDNAITTMSPPHGRKLHRCDSIAKHGTGMDRRSSCGNTNRPIARLSNQHSESMESRHPGHHSSSHKRNVPIRLNDHMSRKRNDDGGGGGGDSQDCREELHVDQNLHPQYVDRHPPQHVDRHSHPQQHVDRDPNPQQHTDQHPRPQQHADKHPHPQQQDDKHPHSQQHADQHLHPQKHADQHLQQHTDRHTHTQQHTDRHPLPQQHADQHLQQHIDRHPHSQQHVDRHSHPQQNVKGHPNLQQHADQHPHPQQHTDRHPHSQQHADRLSHPRQHAGQYPHSQQHADQPSHPQQQHSDQHTHPQQNVDRHTHLQQHADRHPQQHADRLSHAQQHADRHLHAQQHAVRHSHPQQHVDRHPHPQQYVDRHPHPLHATHSDKSPAASHSHTAVHNHNHGHGAANDQHRRSGPFGNRADETSGKRLLQRSSSTLHVEDANACHRCTDNDHEKNETKTGVESHHSRYYSQANKSVESSEHNHHRRPHGESTQRGASSDKNQHSTYRRRLESVDETMESKESNYVGGYLFGDTCYKKKPQKYDTDHYGDSKKVNFSSKPNFEYYHDYVPGTVHSPRDEDCTVFAEVPSKSDDCKNKCHAQNDHHLYSTTETAAAAQTSYYSQLNKSYGDDKNSDSDESLTDSLEDGCKYEGAAVSYFLSLNGQKSAVTFTLKMPNTLESRLNRRHSQLKKHLHVSTTVRKTSTRVRTRHKCCQTLWTEEKGVQVQRGSTANRKSVDDHKVLETLLAGMARHHVSENQIRVVGGQKLISEGNQTERMPEPPTDRQTQTTRDAAAGPETPDNSKKFSSENALMVGVVRQNKYKGKEALDGAKNDQLLTLSKGWINFYTLRADSMDCKDAQELNDNDDEVKTEDDSQQYTVHVQAIPEPVTLPVVHVPNRNNMQLTKTCSTIKHLPKLVQTENNNHHCAPPLATATTNGWCVSVDGPNNMHMKVSLLPDKSDSKTSDHFDHNEENKLESRRLALQRKNNYMRKPYRNMKRTQSTPRDMFSADVSRTESALSAESKYIETIDTQLLIHKARRRLSQEWDTRIQNGGVTESVQLVVTGDSVSSRASQHYANRGHQHCSFRRQSRRI